MIEGLSAVAPVTAVLGNNDRDPWGRGLPEAVTVEIGGVRLHLLHALPDLRLDPRVAALSVVVFGHSHRPETRRQEGVLYFNPGSAGPRRFRLPVTVGRLSIRAGGRVSARIVPLLA